MSALNIPFVSEAYDRLMMAQAKSQAVPLELAPVTDIRAAREKLGMKQSELADRLGVQAPRLSQWENGERFPAYIDLALRALLAGAK